MELFKCNSPLGQSYLTDGEAINGQTSTMWVERYQDPGEFKIEAPLSSGLRSFLPLGAVISHVDTLDAMIVEDHQIADTVDSDPTIFITGRSFESFLDHRMVGANQDWLTHEGLTLEYEMAEDETAGQAVTLINDHIKTGVVINPDDELENVVAVSDVSRPLTSEPRSLKKGSVLERLIEILAIDDLGIRTVRRNSFGVSGFSTTTALIVVQGLDLSNQIVFSWNAGDIDSAEYLWSDKKSKNAALVVGRYCEVAVLHSQIGFARRWMYVDASDLDSHLPEAPVDPALATILNKMRIRGRQTLRRQNEINITSTDISSNTQYRYRKDYNVGDIVSVEGNYGVIEPRRVTEYVEIEDENGASGHPTLAVLS